ncbi:MAG: hypothetical protein AB7K04_01680 [Pseudorhodoplanes sp.]
MEESARSGLPSRWALLAAGLGGLLLAAAVAMWAHLGSKVFYETILAGIAACF